MLQKSRQGQCLLHRDKMALTESISLVAQQETLEKDVNHISH